MHNGYEFMLEMEERGPPIPHFQPPAMSTADKFAFLAAYAGFFLVLILAVHLTALFRAWKEKLKTQRRPAQSSNSSELSELEITQGPPADLPSEPVVEQFLQKASENPKSVALVASPLAEHRYEVTYEDLAAIAQNLAQKLLSFGVGKDTIVVLALDRGVHQLATVYATMLCGAAWVPVDPAVPEHRFKEVLQDSNPVLIIHQEDENGLQVASWSAAAGVCTAVALFDASDLKGQIESTNLPEHSVRPKEMEDVALVIYTSGTTGKPKGIMYSHAMLNHGSHAIADLMEMHQESIAFLKTPYIWAVVEWELFPVLLRGGTLVVGSGTAHKDPQYMSQTIFKEQVTCLVMAPDVLDLLLDVHEHGSELRSLKHVITVGAGLPVALANRFMKMRKLSAKLHNVYGASESSCTVCTVPEDGFSADLWSNRAPVGLPQMGCSVWILDDQLSRVQAGNVGEICFGGQLALGYFKMPELTAEKFITHPEFGRIYRTGDLARWRAGVLEICGRRDRQVKIRGVRVEPEEVESALKTFRQAAPAAASELQEEPASRAAPLLDLEVPTLPAEQGTEKSLKHVACVATSGASPELVAFVSPALSQSETKLVMQHLATVLPPYYLPKYLFSQAELPLLPNGKVNLQALVAEANKSVETSGEVMMDSLGRMRNMSRATILENQVIHRCYAYWMIGVMSDHWNMCGEIGPFCLVPNAKGIVPAWVELFIRQVGNDQDMFGFIFLGALQDSRPLSGETKIRLRLGYADFFCFLVYLLMGFPVPQLMEMILGDTIVNPPCSKSWINSTCSGHRWYLFMIVWVHLCIALCQLLRMPGWLQALGHFAICLFSPMKWFDPCRSSIPIWLKWVFCWVFPYADSYDFNGTVVATCPVMYNWIQWYVLFYVIAFYYSRPGMKFITGMVNRMGCNTAAWAVAAWGIASVAGAAQAAFHYPNQLMEVGIGGKGFHWWFVPLEFGVNMFQPLLLALAMAWFPFDLSWWGNTTLGTYMFHFYFFMYMIKHVPYVLRWLEPVQGLPQLLFLLACPIAFMTTLGPFFHYLLLSPSFVARRAGSILRRRRGAAPAAQRSC